MPSAASTKRTIFGLSDSSSELSVSEIMTTPAVPQAPVLLKTTSKKLAAKQRGGKKKAGSRYKFAEFVSEEEEGNNEETSKKVTTHPGTCFFF